MSIKKQLGSEGGTVEFIEKQECKEGEINLKGKVILGSG